jgi:hypothetical protein
VVAPSANWSGMVSPTTAQHWLHDLRDRIELLISDDPALGIESTIGGDAQASGDLVEAAANLLYHLRSLDGHAAGRSPARRSRNRESARR